MVGVDGSRDMLRYARMNAVDVPLIQADVRRFGLRSRFDGALCLFDSLNHLLSADELTAAFRCIGACLRSGAWFLFDVNTRLSYELHWRGRRRLTAHGCVVRTQSEYHSDSGLGLFRASVTCTADPLQPSSTVMLWQRCHEHEEIVAALRASGFGSIEAYSLEHDALVSGCGASAERVFYLARRTDARSRR